MEHIYLIGYFATSDGKFNASQTTHTLPEAKIIRAFLQDKNKPLKYAVVEGTILPDDEPDPLGPF